MKEICIQSKCCGCNACANICPQKAITLLPDEKGFSYPIIDQALCTNCGICQKVCPAFNKEPNINPLKIFACKNKNEDIRATSSSGGTFQELANIFIEENGHVYGAAFSQNNVVEHIKTSTQDELMKLKGSKYVQSDTKTVFKEVINDLKNNKKVLFSGTPCQIQALSDFPKSNLENLLLVDVVCHGVPSPKIFEDYKEYLEKQYNSKIIKINFRHKAENRVQNIKIDFENGQTYISCIENGDYFYTLFLKDLILRDSCYNCNYKSFNRVSDISLADFWGYDKGIAKEFGDTKGISLVLINTIKGLDYFEKIKNNLHYMEITANDCYPYNCFSNFKIPELYNDFWNEYLTNGFEIAVNKHIKK